MLRRPHPATQGNDARQCCGHWPTLRVDERIVLNTLIPYVRFVCRGCGDKGGLALYLAEAVRLWDTR